MNPNNITEQMQDPQQPADETTQAQNTEPGPEIQVGGQAAPVAETQAADGAKDEIPAGPETQGEVPAARGETASIVIIDEAAALEKAPADAENAGGQADAPVKTEEVAPPAAEDKTNEEGALAAAAAEIASSAPAAPVAETPVPTAEVPDEVENQDKEAAPADERLAYIEEVRSNGTVIQKRILAAIETYCSQMVPRSIIKAADCSSYQHEFLQHLLWLLEKDFTEFRKGWNLLLVYFAAHHGEANTPVSYTPLSEYSTNRHLNAWSKGEERLEAYKNLVTLLRATRDVETRKHDIKTIALHKVGPTVLSEEALTNLKKFYEV